MLTSSSSRCAAFDAVRLCGSPSLFTRMFSKPRSCSGVHLSMSYAALTDFSLSTGSGSRLSASSALTNLVYARLIMSSMYQNNSLLRSSGPAADFSSGCSEKYLSFRSGGRSASRKSSCRACTACTAPRLPPLTLAFSSSASRVSSDFMFATGSSCASTVAAAILSAAVPLVRTSLSHLESADPDLLACFSCIATRSSSAFLAASSLASISRCGSSFADLAIDAGSARVADASYQMLLRRSDSPPPPPPPSLSGRGPAPGFHARPRLGGRSPGLRFFFSSPSSFFFFFFPPAPPSTPAPAIAMDKCDEGCERELSLDNLEELKPLNACHPVRLRLANYCRNTHAIQSCRITLQ